MRHVLRQGIPFCLALVSMVGLAQTGDARPGERGYSPLSGRQRSDRFFKDYLASPFTYVAAAGAASGGEISNDPREWGRGWDGYGKRVGSVFAMFTTDTGVHEAGDAALKLDPRYFRCRCVGGLHRTWFAIEMTLLKYNAEGQKRIDLPQVASAYAAGMTVTTWYPKRYSPLVQGVQMGHQELALDIGVNMIREFGPELKRFFGHFKP